MNSKKTLNKLRGESDRASHTLYLSTTILEEFKSVCDPVKHSIVIEELMREFLDDYNKQAQAQVIKKATIKKS